jgi:MFS family permease
MEQKMSLKEIERKAYLSYHQDGLWDIFLGIFFLGMGILMFFNTIYLMGALAALLPVAIIIKKWFATSRLGYVKFAPKRQTQEKKSRAKLTIILTFTAILGLVNFMAFSGKADWQIWIKNLGIIPFGFVLSLVLGAVGLFFEMKRFVFYAGLILAIFIAGHLTNTYPPAYFILPGIIFLVVGLIMLIRFLHKYPRLKKEVPGGIQ